MAIDFGSSNQTRWYSFGEDGSVNLPDDEWCIGVWVRFPHGLTHAGYQYIICGGTIHTPNSVVLTTEPFTEDLQVYLQGDSGSEIAEAITNLDAPSTDDKLVVLQRRDGDIQAYVLDKNDNVESPTWEYDGLNGNTSIEPEEWNIGRRIDGDDQRYYRNVTGPLFMLANDSLSSSEVSMLATGVNISALRSARLVDFRFPSPEPTEEDLSGHGWDATRNGSGWTDAVDFFTPDTTGLPIAAEDGEEDVSVDVDPGFSGDVESIVIRTVSGAHSKELPFGDSHTDNNPTFDMPDFRDIAFETEWVPYPSSSHELRVEVTSDNEEDEPHVAVLDRRIPSGFAVRELANASTSRGSIFYGVQAPETVPPPTSQIIYPQTNNTVVDSSGILMTNQNGGFVNLWVWRADTGDLEFVQVFIPGQFRVRIVSGPSELEPNTQYTASVENASGLIVNGNTYDEDGNPFAVTLDSVEMDRITFTTSTDLPSGSPVDFDFTV